jgi:hypothetical protein
LLFVEPQFIFHSPP